MASWIFQITRNKINDYYRKKKNELQKEKTNHIEPYIVDTEYNEYDEFNQCVIPMINNLPHKYKEAVMLSEIEGLSQKEMAFKLNISYTGAKSRVQRGRKQLKELLVLCCAIKTDKYGNIIHAIDKNCSNKCN